MAAPTDERINVRRRHLDEIPADHSGLADFLRFAPTLDTGSLIRAAAADRKGYAHLVDTSASDPLGFRYLLFGSRVRFFGNADLTGASLGALRWPALVAQTAADFSSAAEHGPIFHEIRLDRGKRGGAIAYGRLLLPLAHDKNGRASRLLVLLDPRP